MIAQVNSMNDLSRLAANNQSRLVLLDCYTTWCGPCKRMMPAVEALSQKYAGSVVFAKADIEACDDIGTAFQIKTIPVFVMLRNGQPVDRVEGASVQMLQAMLQRQAGF